MDEFIVSSAHPEDLADGTLHGPGEDVSLSAEDQKDPHNAAIIEDGRLALVPKAKKPSGEGGKGGDS